MNQAEHQTMIKHIVMWKLKEQAEGADRAANLVKARALLESCRAIVPGIEAFEVGTATPGLDATYDLVLYSAFTDLAALHAYQAHPEHQKILPFMGAIRAERQCVDFEA